MSVVFLLSPMSVYASEQYDPIEPPVLTFAGYEVLGYDEEGNVEVSNDDYMDYLNQQIEVRSEIKTLALIDDLASGTRIIPTPLWLDFALMAAQACLDNPIHAGETNTFNEVVSSVGKKRILYSKADFYEWITLYFDTDLSTETHVKVRRSALGVTTTFEAYQQEGMKMDIAYSAGQYSVASHYDILGSDGGTVNSCIYMQGMTVNNLPQSTSTSTSAEPNTSIHIWGQWNYSFSRSYGIYAENTYYTNSYEKRVSHDTAIPSNQYFTNTVLMSPILYNTQIDQTNISNYAEYGYTWNDTTNSIDVDLDVLTAWLEANLLPQWQLLYEQTYEDFPEPDATFGESYETERPFETEPPETLPPATGGGGSGGMTPSELQDVLEGDDTYDILDIDTAYPDFDVGALPEAEEFLPDVVSASAGISDFVMQLFSSVGLLPLFVTLSILAFIVFVLRG